MEGGEFLICDRFGVFVARYVDVYYATAVDGGREEDGGEFDLAGLVVNRCQVVL